MPLRRFGNGRVAAEHALFLSELKYFETQISVSLINLQNSEIL